MAPSPASQEASWQWLVVAVVAVAVAVALGLVLWLCRRRRRSGSTTLGPWAGPAQLPEDDGEGGATAAQPLVATAATAPALSTFQASCGSVAMEELPGRPANGDPGDAAPLPEAAASC